MNQSHIDPSLQIRHSLRQPYLQRFSESAIKLLKSSLNQLKNLSPRYPNFRENGLKRQKSLKSSNVTQVLHCPKRINRNHRKSSDLGRKNTEISTMQQMLFYYREDTSVIARHKNTIWLQIVQPAAELYALKKARGPVCSVGSSLQKAKQGGIDHKWQFSDFSWILVESVKLFMETVKPFNEQLTTKTDFWTMIDNRHGELRSLMTRQTTTRVSTKKK